MGATNIFIGAYFILGQANLSFPNYTIERWHTALVTYLIVIFCGVVNTAFTSSTESRAAC